MTRPVWIVDGARTPFIKARGQPGPFTPVDLAVQAGRALPVPRAPARIGCIGALGDQPFPAPLAGVAEIRLAVTVAVGGEAERIAPVDRVLQQHLALAQWQRAQVAAGEMQQIEEVVADVDAAGPRLVGIADLHAALQPREAGDGTLEGHDLAVEHAVAPGPASQRVDQLRVGIAELLAVAAQNPRRAAAHHRHRALAVELALENPARIGKPLIGQGRQRRRPPAGQRLRPGALAILPGQAGERARHPSLPISSMLRPDSTESGSVETGFRRASAASSSTLTSSQRVSSPVPIRCSA